MKKPTAMLGYVTDTLYLLFAVAATIFFIAYTFLNSQILLFKIIIIINIFTMVVYFCDKTSSIRGLWRISEGHLLMFGLLGGWIGAIFAQQWFRHKTRKLEFQAAFILTIVLNTVIMYIQRDNLLFIIHLWK